MDVFKYAYRYSTLEVEHFTGDWALTAALTAADYAADAGTESLAYIEVWEDGRCVRVLSDREVFDEARKLRPPEEKYAPAVASVELKGHDGKWALEYTYQTVEAAERSAGRFADIMGSGGVRVKRLQAAPR